ncbi:MAG: ATP-dependent helicase [Chloroflexota bacterium]
MIDHSAVSERLNRLAPDQRAAATAPPGPTLCVAPAGSGKTTTLVARVAWLIAGGTPADAIVVVTFNRRAAEELEIRLTDALAPLGVDAGVVRVATFHALGREILAEAGLPVANLVARDEILRELFPDADRTHRTRLDLAFSRLKLDHRVSADEIEQDAEAGPVALSFVAYERRLAELDALDFDDLVARTLRLLQTDAPRLARWRARCGELLVDEAQDLDRSQLRLALLLAAPANHIFLVGDDDQTIYGWRLADVRRVLALADDLPGLRRVDLTVNYRCPAAVVDRAVRLVEHNAERFAKQIRAAPAARGSLVLAPDAADDVVRLERAVRTWPDDGSTRAILARTNRELLPAVVIALRLGIPFRAPELPLLILDERVDAILAAARGATRRDGALPLLVALGRARADRDTTPAHASDETQTDGPTDDDVAAALVAWAAAYSTLDDFVEAIAEQRRLLTELRRDDAALTLATAHSTKGLEFDHVVVLADGFPARRAVTEAVEPERVLEEERRLAYVAWTRARRNLTLLYDPAAPSRFLQEAFSPAELRVDAEIAA